MAWIEKDPEAGYYRNDFAGTYVDERTGMTAVEEFPEMFFHCPFWAAWMLQFTGWLHSLAARLCAMFDDTRRP